MKQGTFLLCLVWSILSSAQTTNSNITNSSVNSTDSSTTKNIFILTESAETEDNGISAIESSTTSVETETAATSAVSISRNMDFTKAVGEIPIQSGVTPTGGRTYTVPIAVPEGIGHTPQISLVYNSQQGGNIAGEGWNISGLSSISRCNKSIYYDGTTAGISISNEEFLLDGQRLIPVEYDGENLCFQSVQGNIKATATVSDYLIIGFKVLYPDGRIGEYTSMDEGLLSYPLTKLTDIDGNSINYTYSCTDNTPLIESITYNTYAQIAFTYESRPDVKTSYVNGHKYVSSKRLKKVSCKWENVALDEYTLSYTATNYHSLLTQIDYSREGSSLNPLIFSYGGGEPINNYSEVGLALTQFYTIEDPKHNQYLKILKGKFSYLLSDGVLFLPNRIPYKLNGGSFDDKTCHIENEYNDYPSEDKILIAGGLEQQISNAIAISIDTCFVDVLCTDIEGNQQDYIVKINNINDNGADKLIFSIYDNTTIYGVRHIHTYEYSVGPVFSDLNGTQSVRPKTFQVGDFNGDGRQEVMITVEPVNSHDQSIANTCHVYDLRNNKVLYKGTPFTYKPKRPLTDNDNSFKSMSNSERLLVYDYNGDGKNDLCLINESGISTYEFKTTGTQITSCQSIKQSSFLAQADLVNRELHVGEFNGDGLIDLLLTPIKNNSDKTWGIFYSKGNGDFDSNSFTGVTFGKNNYDGFTIQDVNNDGKTDLIQYTKDSFTTYITINNIPFSAATCTNVISEYASIVPASITSHNRFSQVLTLKGRDLTQYSFQNDATKQNLLTATINSLGNIEYTTYKYPHDSSPSYSVKSSDYAQFPYIILREKIPFISSSYQDIEGSIRNQQSFVFENLIMHRQGLGLCGMERTTFNYEQNGFIKDYKVQEYDPTRHGILLKERNKTSETVYSYEIKYPNNDRIVLVNLTRKETTDNLSGFSSTTEYGHNEYGFPVTEETTTSDGYNSLTIKSLVHHNTSSGYMLNILKEQTTTTTKDELSYTEQFSCPSMYYNKPLEKYTYINGGQVSYETFTYTAKGQLAKQTIRSYSSPYTLTTSYEYDNYGRMTKETTPEQLTKEYTYLYNGLIQKYKDELGRIELYAYDNLGRVIRTERSGSPTETVTYKWHQGSPFDSYGYIVQKELSDGYKEEVYYNPNRQVVCTSQNTAFDYNMVEYKTYDYFGNILTQSIPVKSSSSLRPLVRYTYDEYNRLASIQEPSGRITTYAYNNNRTTTVEDGIETIRTYDSQGNMTEVTDTTGTTTYIYRPDGQLISTTVPCGLTTTMEYDYCGRQTKLIDPCAGTTTFTYDASGNMASKTDGSGKQTLMEYDQYGRLTLENHVGTVSTTYTYNDKGLLIGEHDSNGAERTYEYDDFSRLAFEYQCTDNAETHNLHKGYEYGRYGELARIVYDKDNADIAVGIEYREYQNGHLKSVSFEDLDTGIIYDVWTILSCNDFGQPNIVTSGPLTHTFEYDASMFPARFSTVRDNGTVRDMKYTFNPQTGNLGTREDVLNEMVESFSYDNMNRLTGDNAETYSYDNQTGNITYNSRIGNLSYGNRLQPGYQLTAVDPMGIGATSSNHITKTRQDITYNALSRPATITEGDYHLDFTYNGNGERIHSYFYKKETPDVLTGTVTTDLEHRYYLGNIYERHIKGNGSNRYILYVGGDAYSAPAAFVVDDRNGAHMAYICRDYQGSITHVVTDQFTEENSFDAWGNRRNPKTHSLQLGTLTNDLYLGRGYTGHEHHTHFGLINMNARLYEPIVGRFISPDPFVQMPDNSQNFNRYTYCLNNPLRYTDESGEFFFSIINAVKDFFVNTFVKVWSQGVNAWTDSDNWHSTQMAFKIDMGLFKGDYKQILSRFTWELPQNILGYGLAQGYNFFNDVKSVTYYGGATAIERYSKPDSDNKYGSAVTLGSFISGDRGLQADPYNPLFQHEYGHYLQSQAWGLMYLGKGGIPSMISALLSDKYSEDHLFDPIEQDANARAFEYFNKNVQGFYENNGWNFTYHPIDITGMRYKGFVDYKQNINKVRKLRLSIKLIEPLMIDHVSLGVYNIIRYNKIETRRKKGLW